ncbi:HAD family hydrolase [Chthonobacter rhizosphaerae]|uniref:HAD family hydrolase n=1 Tax=Chthonobacter rhizosphaerae TaxID=2735553 RepID=UPI0015EF854C|nr:HAD family hydrolase [Chthonobacter rhizosphaerae]
MLIIFDCDGVLIDSEIIAAQVNAEILTEYGFEITAAEMNSRFVGLTGPQIVAIIEEELGRSLPDEFKDRADDEIDRRLGAVKAIVGIHELLDTLDWPRCICSNSSTRRLKLSLEAAGLYDRFKPYIFSAPEVGTKRGKPAPDVFLHAAKAFDVDPRSAVVIEDSVPGVTGAVAAGMRVIGFTGGLHTWAGHGEALMDAGAETVVRRLREVGPVVEAFRAWNGLEA